MVSPSNIFPSGCFLNVLWFWMVLSGQLGHVNMTSFIVKKGSLKQKNFGISGKITWFWSTFKKESRVKPDVTRWYRVLIKFVTTVGKYRKLKVFGLYSSNYYCVSCISFIKIGFFWALWKDFSTDFSDVFWLDKEK